MSTSMSAPLDLNTRQDAVKNLKQCLESYATALEAAAKVTPHMRVPGIRGIIANNFAGDALKPGRFLPQVLSDLKRADVDYNSTFNGSLQVVALNDPAKALKTAVQAVERLVAVDKGIAATAARQRLEWGSGSDDDDGDDERDVAPLLPPRRGDGAASGRPPRYPSSSRGSTVSPPSWPSGPGAATKASRHKQAVPSSSPGGPVPLAAPAVSAVSAVSVPPAGVVSSSPVPSSTPPVSASFSSAAPSAAAPLSLQEKMRKFFQDLATKIASSSSFSLGWTLAVPSTAVGASPGASESYTLTSRRNTHPNIKVEVLADSTMKFVPDNAKVSGSGSSTAKTPNTEFFRDYFRLIFLSLEASGQKFQLQNSVRDLLAGLQAQYGLADTHDIENGLKAAVVDIGGKAKLASFMAGQTLTDFDALASSAPAAKSPVPAPAVPPVVSPASSTSTASTASTASPVPGVTAASIPRALPLGSPLAVGAPPLRPASPPGPVAPTETSRGGGTHPSSATVLAPRVAAGVGAVPRSSLPPPSPDADQHLDD